ncbi:MAG: 3-deoxy-D-manno-octulosonic acid transferase [Candidatus Eisenbacteria bacterium]
MNLLWNAYRAAAPLLGAVAPGAGWLTRPEERRLWSERLGKVVVEGGVDAWIHAASMGEALAAESLVTELRVRQPGARLALTATTRGGRTRLTRLDERATLAPIDSPQAVSRFLRGVQPARLFLLETELWFHWLLAARAAGIPVSVISARLSPRSLPRYRRFGPPLKRLIGDLAAVLCQGESDAARWRELGATPERTAVVGNLKNDALPGPVADRGAARVALGLDADRPLLVLGSLRPGEVTMLAEAWAALPVALRGSWQVTAVPRHPQAAAGLAEEARRAGQVLTSEGAPRDGAWRWDPRLGVLTTWYQACDVAFVGGSLARFGGHNPLEPAACGAAVVTGPHHATQLDAVRALAAADAVWVCEPGDALTRALMSLLSDERLRRARQHSALEVAEAARGAAARAVKGLVEWRLWPVR